MNFHEIRFPSTISFGSSGGIERRTEIATLVNGFEERNSPWAHSRRRYDAGIGVRSLDDLADVLKFFEARRAQLFGFRWKDWIDHKSCQPSQTPTAADQALVAGDDPSVFQLIRTYDDGHGSYTRTIRKPVAGTVTLAIDGVETAEGVDFSVDYTTGEVTFSTTVAPSASVTAGFEFDVPVRFETDSIDVNLSAFEAGEIPSIPIIEVRV